MFVWKRFFYQKSIWLESIQMCITDWGDAADGADNMQTNGRPLDWRERSLKSAAQNKKPTTTLRKGWGHEEEAGEAEVNEDWKGVGGRKCTKRMKYENGGAKRLPTCGAFCCYCSLLLLLFPVCYCTFACWKETKAEVCEREGWAAKNCEPSWSTQTHFNEYFMG